MFVAICFWKGYQAQELTHGVNADIIKTPPNYEE